MTSPTHAAALEYAHDERYGAAWNYRRGCRCDSCRTYKKEQQKGSYTRRREKRLGQLRAQYAADPEKFRQRARDQRKRTGKTYHKPEKARASRLLLRYGLTIERFNEMLREQGWACVICRVSFVGFTDEDGPSTMIKPCVDHDHKTGAVRGLLCNDCNGGLGYFKDNTEALASAILYLARRR